MAHLYNALALELASRIDAGVYQTGQRLPGVRATSQTRGVSTATAVAAYRKLEDDGYIESRPRSGFYVRNRVRAALPEPRQSRRSARPIPVNGQQMMLGLVQSAQRTDLIRFGTAVPDHSYLPTRAIEKALASAVRMNRIQISSYEFSPGLLSLRQQIARRMGEAGCITDPDDVLITNGCQESLYLALKSLTVPGDVVAVESPTYYGLLQVIDALGLKALEIPTHPGEGMGVEALQLALEQWPVKACVVTPNFNNPLGCLMPHDRRVTLLDLARRHGLSLIEDDIYGDLGFDQRRPDTLLGLAQSMGIADLVIYCSSFSKTLAPGLRIGWLVSTAHRDTLTFQKFVMNSASPSITQLAVCTMLESGRYERHIRGMRQSMAQVVHRMADRLCQHFPMQTCITRPQGGFVIWVELPNGVDANMLAQRALEKGISIAPGPLFSATQKYRNHIRLSCAVLWNERVEKALRTLGQLVKDAAD
ncbi:MAG: PLP-dependent aminotransferase family protein [Gammaproteobacteria bacterium]|nr:PLP-dependent aminotransferase family protein [Gammaproteobacteria bacterium]